MFDFRHIKLYISSLLIVFITTKLGIKLQLKGLSSCVYF